MSSIDSRPQNPSKRITRGSFVLTKLDSSRPEFYSLCCMIQNFEAGWLTKEHVHYQMIYIRPETVNGNIGTIPYLLGSLRTIPFRDRIHIYKFGEVL